MRRTPGLTRLRAQRLMRGLTVEDAAAALEVKAPSLYYWERTGGMPRDPAVVQRITQFYDVALTEIWPVQEAAA